jgi:methionyl aminopeptidase
MRRAGRIVALALRKVGEAIRPGVTTAELDRIAEDTIRGMAAIPSFLGYRNYPASACVSVNDEVVHGIPGPRILRAGDVVGVDLGAMIDGLHADAAYTFPVGEVSPEIQRLMLAGRESLDAGIAVARAGNRVRDIGAAVEQRAQRDGYAVVRDLCGHGVGRKLHEEPQIPNHTGDRSASASLVLRTGMALAIEPMINAGVAGVELQDDGWTFVTVDGRTSVHYEHTVLIQADGPEIVTTLV